MGVCCIWCGLGMVSAPIYDWEKEENQWDDLIDRVAFNLDECDPDPDLWSPEECSEEFFNLVISMKGRGRIYAKEACLLCYLSSRAGQALRGEDCKGAVWRLGKKPGSDHFPRHFDKIVQPNGLNEDQRSVPCPIWNRFDGSRGTENIAMLNVHETLAQEVANNDTLLERLQALHDEALLPPVYYSSPVVVQHGEGVFPLVVYMDSVPFAKKDAAFGLFIYNIITGMRHLVLALRKNQLCRCGCKGWCTLYPALLHVRHCTDAAADGTYPRTGFPLDDEVRAGRAGSSLGAKFTVIFTKGDMMEFVKTLAFAGFGHRFFPCPVCRAPREELSSTDNVSSVSFSFAAKTYNDMDQACLQCEVEVVLSLENHSFIRSKLAYDRRGKLARGRYLSVACEIGGVHIDKYDRLEPCVLVQDIGAGFDNITGFPVTVLFWRTAKTRWVYHRNPMWSPQSGHTHDRTLVFDWLHTLSLGLSKHMLQQWNNAFPFQLIAFGMNFLCIIRRRGRLVLTLRRLLI